MTTLYLAKDRACARCRRHMDAPPQPATHIFLRSPIAHENNDCECVRWHSSAAAVTFPGGHSIGDIINDGDALRMDAERVVCAEID